MKRKSFFLLFTLLLLSNISLFALNTKNVLIINSYHRGFIWSDDIINGVEKILYPTKINLNVLYMDSKRISSDNYYKELKELYQLQLRKQKYDLVVAIDRFAYEFSIKNYNELFNDSEIYFVGIEQFSRKQVEKYNLENKVSGLLEKRAINQIIQSMHKLIPNLERLYIINDTSKNGNDTDPFIQSAINSLNRKIDVEYIRRSTLEKLKKRFSVYKKNEAILFIRFYNDENGYLYKNNEIASMINQSKIPVFTTDTLFINQGSIGGKLVDIKQLGINAGEDILGILNNSLKTPFLKVDNSYKHIFDYQKAQEFKIRPENLNLHFSYINTPKSFFDEYRKFIDVVFIVSPFLLLLIFGLIHNLYLRIQRNKILKQRMAFDKILLDSINNPIVWQDDNGDIVDCNAKFREFMEFRTPDEKNIPFKEHFKDFPYVPIKFALQSFINKSHGENQFTIKTKKNEDIIYLVNQTNYTESIYSTSGTVTVLADITKEKQAIVEKAKHQEFIIQQSKLAEIGEIFSSIAHQWKSPLVEIATIAQEQLYDNDGEIDEKNSAYVNDIMVQVKYMTETVNNFQKFIMPSTQKIVFDIRESVHEMLAIIDHNMKYNYIDINVEVKPNTNLIVLGYKNELMQTLLNIVNNAKDAIIKQKADGKIEQGKINIFIENITNFVQIEIEDNGGGIPDEYIKELFEPYFTTKKNGHGIGLYMAKLIIEDKMQGKIKATNGQNGGIFTIKLETTNEDFSS